MLKTYKFTFLFIAWMMLITILSLASLQEIEDLEWEIVYFDKLAHFVVYFIATFLGCFFIRERTKGRFSLRSSLWVIAISMVIYGTIIEVIQYRYTADRSGEFYDIIANISGVMLSIVVILWFFSRKSGLKWKY